MLEKYLIEQCAPTLASLKTASLFCLAVDTEEELANQIRIWNGLLKGKGLSLVVMKRQKGRALIYVYRKSHLQADLRKPGAARFLGGYGYRSIRMDYALDRLKKRLEESETFPHEIGLFLGYPLGDVIGFIRNQGKNCKCTGYWKVYSDECEARRLFADFRKCRESCVRLWKQGWTVWQLTVAA